MNPIGLIIYPASDMPKTTKFFATMLGVEPYANSPYYVGFKSGGIEVGLVPKEAHGTSAPLAFVTVGDINKSITTLVAAGAEKLQEPTDVSNGLLVARINDLDGTPIGLRQYPTKS